MRNLSVLLFVILLAACSSAPTAQKVAPQAVADEKPYFDASLVEELIVGKSTQKDVLVVMGPPYPDDPEKETGRLVYMYTLKRQVIFTFDGVVLKSKEWTDIYGIHMGK